LWIEEERDEQLHPRATVIASDDEEDQQHGATLPEVVVAQGYGGG